MRWCSISARNMPSSHRIRFCLNKPSHGCWDLKLLLVADLGLTNKRCLFTPMGADFIPDAWDDHPTPPPTNGVKRPRPTGVGHSSVCFPEAKWVWLASDGSLINHSNCLSKITLWLSFVCRSFLSLVDFATVFTQMTAHSCAGNRSNLQWMI